MITSLVLAAGFFMLGQSQFALTAQQANMTGATILVAVLFDLAATPALLVLFSRAAGARRKKETQIAATT